MTSEVMLLNVQGAALAADSALTAIEYHRDGSVNIRYQTGADKIFLLEQKLPVAAMIFDVAEFNRYPWSTVFETFRTCTPKPGDNVASIAQSLMKFLGGWTAGTHKKAASLLPIEEDVERLNFAIYIAATIQRFEQCVELAGARNGKATPKMIEQALDMLRFETQFAGEYFQNLFLPAGQPPQRRPMIGEATPRLIQLIDQFMSRLVDGITDSIFGDNVITGVHKKTLSEITVASCVTDWLPPGVPQTGIVFSGYNDDEVRPAYLELSVGSAFGGLVKFQLVKAGAPNNREPAIIQSFAQADLIDALLRGAQPGYKYVLFQLMRQGIGSLLNAIGGELAKKDTTLSKSILHNFEQAPLAISRAILMAGDDIAKNAMEMRVSDVVNSASAEKLAEYAGKMVLLSVIEHELTGSQSVAEPILALHMKKGSAQWIRHVTS